MIFQGSQALKTGHLLYLFRSSLCDARLCPFELVSVSPLETAVDSVFQLQTHSRLLLSVFLRRVRTRILSHLTFVGCVFSTGEKNRS